MRRILFILFALVLSAQTVDKGRILMVIAHHGFRDEELKIPKGLFVEAGYRVEIASTDTTPAEGMLGLKVKPDLLIGEAAESLYVALVLVGGVGAQSLFSDTTLHSLIGRFYEAGKPIGAICLAPVILGRAGILKGRKATVWPGAKEELIRLGARYLDREVVQDSTIITGAGPQAAELFGRKILQSLK
ncbi:DJ-1 family protein [candidate division WOR-3 bacterium]|uniref:DJ-1 family protein n=1 Tax=candidate division WOR-3 bacterium TaxID=2052148 RepID=A0A660SGS8_UNCW3|nr:MAG: DJ-1 family protein [candidate division WOR-3 bacterium]